MKHRSSLLLAVGMALASVAAHAVDKAPPTLAPLEALTPQEDSRDTADVDDLIMSSEGFLTRHPDLKYRLLALTDYRKGEFAKALSKFKRAARFADKPSQGMVAEMLWDGRGVPVDRPTAYIWMDLAAERGYKMMLVKRELYWEALTAAERERALDMGDALYGEYADKYAKPRLESKLRQARSKTTGSRTGFASNLSIEIPTATGLRTIRGDEYYKAEFWKPEQYWAMQDSDWKDTEGRVDVGEIQLLDGAAEPKKNAGDNGSSD